MIGRLDLIMVVVKDMQRSAAFYRDVLELEPTYESPDWTQLSAGPISIGLHLEGEEVKVKPDSGCTFGFAVPDVRKTADELKRKGVRFIREPRKEDFGWHALFTDPDGYVLQLVEQPQGVR
jgi:predicted enzyme related to lactoylglutathione lyase